MKKILSMLLALTLVFALTAAAFASEYNTSASDSQDVEADYTAPVDAKGETVYRIVIAWDATAGSNLSYTGKDSTYTWNTTDLVYDENVNSDKGWEGSTGYTVTVTNYSNAAVSASTEAKVNYELTLTTPDETAATLGSAAVKADGNDIDFTDTTTKGTAQVANFTYTYAANETATEPTSETNKVTVGSITVNIAV